MRDEDEAAPTHNGDTLRLTTDIVSSFVGRNDIASQDLPELIRSVHATLSSLAGAASERLAERPKPAVPINRSVQDDYIVCLEDGKRLKMLKRYLRSTYGLSPDDYRKRWGLAPDYPMVAPNYAARRSEFAKAIGLGKGVRRKE